MLHVCPSEVNTRTEVVAVRLSALHTEKLCTSQRYVHSRACISTYSIPTIQEPIFSCCRSLFSILTTASTLGFPKGLKELLWKAKVTQRSARWWDKESSWSHLQLTCSQPSKCGGANCLQPDCLGSKLMVLFVSLDFGGKLLFLYVY